MIPDAASPQLTEPTKRVGIGWLLAFALAWFGFWLLIVLPGQFMVLKLATVLDPLGKVASSSFMIAEMSVVIVTSVPFIGVACDRTRSRFGRRRAWILGGFITATVPFAFVGAQASWPLAALLLGVVSLGQAAVLVALSAVIADQVPREQRGRASAAMGVPQVIALAGGMVVVTMLVTDVAQSWFVIAALALASSIPFLVMLRDTEPGPLLPRARFRMLRRSDLHGYRDFSWAMLSRVLINAGNLTGTTYLLYFLADVLHVPDPDEALTTLIFVYLGACAAASWLSGILSDKWQMRRHFVAASAALQAAAALCLAFVPTWESAMVAAVLLGFGFGTFLAVDQALITDVLPRPESRARDLGIINSAQYLPIAPLVGWLVLGFAGYSELYAVTAAIIIAGGIVVYRIRSVR